jgi:hypothetical protein
LSAFAGLWNNNRWLEWLNLSAIVGGALRQYCYQYCAPLADNFWQSKNRNSQSRMFTCHTGQVSGSVMFFAVQDVQDVEGAGENMNAERDDEITAALMHLDPAAKTDRSGKPNF